MRDPILEVHAGDAPRAVEALREAPEVIEAGLAVREVREVPPSLEDVFVARVRATGGAAAE